jgi:hypothetical protein
MSSATRFHLIFSALDALGIGAEQVLYSEEMEEKVRAHLLWMVYSSGWTLCARGRTVLGLTNCYATLPREECG